MRTRTLLLLAALLAAACQKSGAGSERSAAQESAPAAKGELLGAGAPAPKVRASAHTGESVDLAALQGRPVVVYFYPKDDTPGCTVEAQEIRDLWSQIKDTSAVVIGVSADDPASHQQFAEKHALPFLLFSDMDHSIAHAFGVPVNNGRPRRVSFLIDRQGKIAKVFPEVKPQGHGRELLDAIRALG
jgi:peroxiredoxin Q/BCP